VTRLERIGPEPLVAVEWAGESAGGGPLLVFLHGIGGNRTNWHAQLAHFSGRFTAVAWDARGYGDSDDYDGPLDFADFSADLLKVIAHFGRAKAHLCGLSMGGRIALDFWRRHPERVATLVLADTSAGSAEAQDPAKIEAFLALRRQPLLDGKTPADLAPELVKAIAGPHIGAAELAHLTASLAALHRDSYIKTLETVTRYTGFPAPERVTARTLVVVGAEDRIAPPHMARAMAAAMPDARLAVIPEAGHISNVERPAAFNAALDAFYAEAA
jgi:3-oxoadipate enol-lactonase